MDWQKFNLAPPEHCRRSQELPQGARDNHRVWKDARRSEKVSIVREYARRCEAVTEVCKKSHQVLEGAKPEHGRKLQSLQHDTIGNKFMVQSVLERSTLDGT